MPGQKGTSQGLSALNKALQAHKGDETVYDSQASLPAGIENGTAELSSIQIGHYKNGTDKGKPFFMASGTVLTPEEFDGAPIKGLRTQIGPMKLFDYTTGNGDVKTQEEQVAKMLNELRKLGLDTNQYDSADALVAVFPQMVKAGIVFRFRTWKGAPATEGKYKGKEPQVQHVWNGTVDVEGGETEQPDIDTSPDQSATDNDNGEDIDALVERANNKDVTAQKRLEELASEAGFDSAEIDTWEEVGERLKSGSQGDDENGGENSITPERGDVYNYQKGKKLHSCEVTSVSAKNETCSLTSQDTKEVFKAVPWSDLIPIK